MQKKIFKYPVEINDTITIDLPLGARILSVQTQNNSPMMWALVDPTEPTVPRNFEVFGTGHPINYDTGTDRRFVGTFQINGGSHVFHLFERFSDISNSANAGKQ